MAIPAQRQQLYDGVAIGASILCLIHCLLLPVLIILVPTLAGFLAAPEEFHIWALALAVPTSVLALLTGYRRHHWVRPAMIAFPGLILLAAGALLAPSERAETLLSVVGAVLLALGHSVNWWAMNHIRTPAAESGRA